MAYQQDFQWYPIVDGFIVPAISVFGIIGNLFNLFVLNRMKSKASIFIYFTYMAVSDLVTCSLLFFGAIARVFTFLEFWWQIYDVYIFMPICNTSMCVSALIIVMVTVERVILIQNSDIRERYCRRRTAHRVCLTIIPICGVFNAPLVLAYYVDRELGITETSFYSVEYYRIFNWTRFSLLGIFPAVFLAVANVVLICSVRRNCLKQKALISQNKHLYTKRIREQTRLTATLIGIIVMFLLGDFTSYLATPVLATHMFYAGDEAGLNTFSFDMIKSVLGIFMVIHYSFNFILYCTLNSQFLAIVRDAGMCRRRTYVIRTNQEGLRMNKY